MLSKHALQQGGCAIPACLVAAGGAWSGGFAPEGMCGPGVAWSREGCLVRGGLLRKRGAWSGGGGAWWRPPPTATAAGGTHPTGMHSCFKYIQIL